ncbi:MFS transporter [Brevibacillus sp. B_LB10_24]|uniref:MFS transporter n=1 Tax=Brevibacillus sp. B_LB10_24 TaxID=3380645 RepID=UPI0038BC5BCB
MNDKVVMPVWSIGTFLVLMNTTMFNVAIPSIIQELHLTAGPGSWIVSGYSIVFAMSTMIFSRLSDYIPIRMLLSIGLGLLGISSILGYLAHHFDILLAARLMQASGAGSVPGLGMVLASRYVPYERRGRAVSMIASAAALAFGLGPVAGGMITEFFGWNGLFLVTCLVFPLAPILWKLLPQESGKAVRFDILGAALTAVATGSLLVAVQQKSAWLLLISMISLMWSIRHFRRVKEPFLQPVLFRNSGYRKLLLIAFCAFVLNMSMLFLMPLALAGIFQKEAAAIGTVLFPGAMLSALLSRLFGHWIDRYGNTLFLLCGHVLLAVVMVVFSLFIHLSAFVILAGYMIFAPSFSAVTSALSNEVSRILPKELIGSGIGLTQLSQFIGGSFAVAVCGILLVGQSNQPLISVFQHIFLLLLPVVLGSLLMYIWYLKKEAGRQKRLSL